MDFSSQNSTESALSGSHFSLFLTFKWRSALKCSNSLSTFFSDNDLRKLFLKRLPTFRVDRLQFFVFYLLIIQAFIDVVRRDFAAGGLRQALKSLRFHYFVHSPHVPSERRVKMVLDCVIGPLIQLISIFPPICFLRLCAYRISGLLLLPSGAPF